MQVDSSEASVSERDPLSQRFSVSVHPRLPIILSSDGYLVTVMQLPSVASYQGVMTGFMRDITRCALMKSVNMLLSLRAKMYALKCIFFSCIVKPVCNTYRNVDVKPKKKGKQIRAKKRKMIRLKRVKILGCANSVNNRVT